MDFKVIIDELFNTDLYINILFSLKNVIFGFSIAFITSICLAILLNQCKIIDKKSKELFLMAVITITKDNFKSEVLESDKPVLLDFWATWCGPCRMVSPIVDEISEERSDIKVGKINVDEQMELAQQFRIVSIPTLVVMKDGQIANKAVGAMPKEDILALL